jgi:hypothetical protein
MPAAPMGVLEEPALPLDGAFEPPALLADEPAVFMLGFGSSFGSFAGLPALVLGDIAGESSPSSPELEQALAESAITPQTHHQGMDPIVPPQAGATTRQHEPPGGFVPRKASPREARRHALAGTASDRPPLV